MPALEQTVIDDLASRLKLYLLKKDGYSEPEYLSCGGSAAIFKSDTSNGPKVFKAFAPKFFDGESGLAEKRRLDVQRRLIGHQCESIIQTYQVEEADGTAFLEMEYIPWPDLNQVLSEVPDQAVPSLVLQLVEAARFLEGLGIVHRDIKPENIKVSPDFEKLKLLDLGVARDIDAPDGIDAGVTDHNNRRPFLATAQYSSPEYLFRLDEPSPKLWKGLNFYQIGAVIHDLIMKVPIFHQEMEMGNRWLVSKAVLTKTPSFTDGEPTRLRQLKALAARCLVKDLDLRLRVVGWEDFTMEGQSDPLNALRGRLSKGALNVGQQMKVADDARLDFERNSFAKRFTDRVRAELISACGTILPITMPPGDGKSNFTYLFSPPETVTIRCDLFLRWGVGVHSRDAHVEVSSLLSAGRDNISGSMPPPIPVCGASLDCSDDSAVTDVATAIARAVAAGLDIIESAQDLNDIQEKNLMGVF